MGETTAAILQSGRDDPCEYRVRNFEPAACWGSIGGDVNARYFPIFTVHQRVRQAGGVPQAIDALIAKLIDAQFTHRDENRFLTITLRSGKKEVLYRGDLISGAIIASIVERAKGLAIKRAIATGNEEGISESDLLLSLDAEYAENDIFPPSDVTEDWLQLIDYDSENVVKVSPVRAGREEKSAARSSIV